MRFLLLSRHTGGQEVPENEKGQNLTDLVAWWALLDTSVALPLSGGKSITSTATEDYDGEVEGMLVFEAQSLDEAVEKARRSPGLKYGWTHDS